MKNNPVIERSSEDNEYAFLTLRFVFFVAPFLAGLDKFFNTLTLWPKYLAPMFPDMLGITPQSFMFIVGFVEMAVGIGMLFKTKLFSYVVSLWLVGIIINLLMIGNYYDVALRDLGLAISAFALAKLADAHERRLVDGTAIEKRFIRRHIATHS